MAQVSKGCGTSESAAVNLGEATLPSRFDFVSTTLGHLRHALKIPKATAKC